MKFQETGAVVRHAGSGRPRKVMETIKTIVGTEKRTAETICMHIRVHVLRRRVPKPHFRSISSFLPYCVISVLVSCIRSGVFVSFRFHFVLAPSSCNGNQVLTFFGPYCTIRNKDQVWAIYWASISTTYMPPKFILPHVT